MSDSNRMSDTTNPELNIQEIQKFLPHRQPFLFVDRVLEMNIEKPYQIVASKNVSFNEPYFAGHFPDLPVMPGVIILEAMAQTGCILANNTPALCAQDNRINLLVSIDKARFKRVVVPGDTLRIEVNYISGRKNFHVFHAQATVDGEIACEAKFTSAAVEQTRL